MKKRFSAYLPLSIILIALSNLSLAAENNIAVVDIHQIVKDSLAAKTIHTQIEKKKAEYQAIIDKKEEELNKNNQELIKQQSVLSKEAFDEKVKDFNNRVSEVQREVQTKKSALDQASFEALGEIQNVIDDIVLKLAKEKNFAVAIPTSQILYFDPKLDISKEILTKLNDRLKKVEVKIKANPAATQAN